MTRSVFYNSIGFVCLRLFFYNASFPTTNHYILDRRIPAWTRLIWNKIKLYNVCSFNYFEYSSCSSMCAVRTLLLAFMGYLHCHGPWLSCYLAVSGAKIQDVKPFHSSTFHGISSLSWSLAVMLFGLLWCENTFIHLSWYIYPDAMIMGKLITLIHIVEKLINYSC